MGASWCMNSIAFLYIVIIIYYINFYLLRLLRGSIPLKQGEVCEVGDGVGNKRKLSHFIIAVILHFTSIERQQH